MWDLIVLDPDQYLSFYFSSEVVFFHIVSAHA